VPKHVRVSQVERQPGRHRVAVEQVTDRLFRERVPTSLSAAKQVRAAIGRTHCEVRTEELLTPAMERVPVAFAALEARDPDLVALDVGQLDERDFPSSQSMSVREIEEEQVADVLLGNAREEALNLLFRVVLDWPLLARAAGPCSASFASRRWALPLGMNGDFAGNPGFH
jgi:hypothetical protein